LSPLSFLGEVRHPPCSHRMNRGVIVNPGLVALLRPLAWTVPKIAKARSGSNIVCRAKTPTNLRTFSFTSEPPTSASGPVTGSLATEPVPGSRGETRARWDHSSHSAYPLSVIVALHTRRGSANDNNLL
jgi:hypothetical protein